MGFIFILLGKTYSYKKYIKEHCSHNPALHCCDVWEVDEHKVNVVYGNIDDHVNLVAKYKHQVYPVYIDTPDDQILKAGLEEVEKGCGTYRNLCEMFVKECDKYSDDVLIGIEAHMIQENNACDACYEFIAYVREVLTKHGCIKDIQQ